MSQEYATGRAMPPDPADVEYFARAQAGGWGHMLRSFLKFAQLPAGSEVLDVGTGPGLLMRLALEGGARSAVGCDRSLEMIEHARSVHSSRRRQHVVGDLGRLPFPDNCFDVVLATNVFFLLCDAGLGVIECRRVLRPGGILAFLNPTSLMTVSRAEDFAESRGLNGFERYSFVSYARLAETHQRLSGGEWLTLAERSGLIRITSEDRAAGMVQFVRGAKVSE